jgi:hypothetical protein
MKMRTLLISILAFPIISCSGMQKKLDCRHNVDATEVKKQIVADLKERFPKHDTAAISDYALAFDESGMAYYPATVRFKTGEIYSIIYNYSPTDSECKKLNYQFIKLTPL